MSLRGRDPVPLRRALAAVADDLHTATPDRLAALQRVWPVLVG